MDLARPVAFADDTFLQGAQAPTMRAFHALTALAAPFGLRAQPVKCAVYSEDTATAASVAAALGMRHAPEQASTLPISNVGIPASFARILASKARHFRHFFW
jgi:hypothetical protein